MAAARFGAAKPSACSGNEPLHGGYCVREDSVTALGLKQAGLVDGIHYALVLRFADGDYSRLPELAKELDGLKPRVLVIFASATAIAATRKQAPNTPLVFTGIAMDPIASGLAESYARPGGMMTGNVMNALGGEESLTTKRTLAAPERL